MNTFAPEFSMSTLRVIGDVHAQFNLDDLMAGKPTPYLGGIADAQYSVQIGDMGDEETYARLVAEVDAERHRFFPGNHEHYDNLPPHSLGDYGTCNLGGVDFFFVRGAASADREKLLRLGKEMGRTLWYPQAELTADQMSADARRLAVHQCAVRAVSNERLTRGFSTGTPKETVCPHSAGPPMMEKTVSLTRARA